MIELKNVSISFKEKPVIKNFSLQVRKGEFVSIIGKNGSGKSTLALLMAGIIPKIVPAKIKGKISVRGKTGLILQNPSSQFFSMTVKEELGKINAKKFNLQSLINKSVFQLSEGEKQKINLISNISNNVEILLLDEPLELLDPKECQNFLNLLKNQWRKGKTIIWFDKDETFVKESRKIFLTRK
jgi:energy-coupling factor transport system ATP-binding protein